MAGRTKFEEIIDPDALPRMIREAEQYLGVLQSVKQGFTNILTETQKLAGGKTPLSIEGIQQTTNAYNAAKTASEGLTAAQARELLTKEKLLTLEQKRAQQAETFAAKQERATAKELADQAKLENAYYKVQASMKRNLREYQNLATKKALNISLDERQERRLNNLARLLQKQDAALKQVDMTMGRHQRNVGNYASGYNGLNMSINQITRELPNFAMRLETGFLAISNNLPMLSDQINILKLRNAELAAQGKATVPVIKQLAAAFMSWQTAMSFGITLLTIYGADIARWVKGLFGAADASEALREREKERQEQMDATRKSLEATAAKEIANLNVLLAVAQDTTKTYEQRSTAVDELQKKYGQYFSNLSKEQIMAGQIADAYERVVSALYSKIAIGLYEEELQTNIKDQIQLNKVLKEQEKIVSDLTKRKQEEEEAGAGPMGQGSVVTAKLLKDATDKLNQSRSEGAQIYFKQRDIIQEIVKLTTEYNEATNKATKSTKDNTKAKKEQIEVELDLEAIYRDKISSLSEISSIEIQQAEETARTVNEKLQKISDDGIDQGKKALAKKRDAQKVDMAQTLKQIDQFNSMIQQRQLQQNQYEIDRAKSRQDQLKELAAQGNKDAQQSLALEERKQAELERKRAQILKRQKQQELALSVLKAYSANVEKDPNTALVKTIKDAALLTAAVKSLEGFYDGTENVGESLGKPALKGKDGYVVRVDGSERVLTGKQNQLIGDLSNDELANIANLYNKGVLLNYSTQGVGKDKTPTYIASVADKIGKEVTKALEGIEIHNFTVDEANKLIKEQIKSGNTVQNNYYTYKSQWR